MNEPIPPWVESLIQSNQLVAQALMSQARANSELALVINRLLDSEAQEQDLGTPPLTYLDGSPR